jgi:hypothetical protein
MSAADKRISELLERWLTTLQVHAGYLDLSNEDYARAQAWPPHQRPTRWIIDLARSRTAELKRIADERQAAGDAAFADALELMSFLTTLLGAEHVERFIPHALPPKTAQSVPRTTAPAARPAPAAATAPTRSADAETDVPTIAPVLTPTPREPPATAPARVIPAARQSPPARVIPAASARSRADATVLRPSLRGASAKSTGSGSRSRVTPAARTQNTGAQRTAARGGAAAARGDTAPTRAVTPASARLSEKAVNQVIADAVRMLEWGREWPQLAGLIARLADRPSEKDVWRVLREHKATIESRAKLPAD